MHRFCQPLKAKHPHIKAHCVSWVIHELMKYGLSAVLQISGDKWLRQTHRSHTDRKLTKRIWGYKWICIKILYVLKVGYIGISRSIPWIQIPWLFVWPSHQLLRYSIYFHFLYHLSVVKLEVMQSHFTVLEINSAIKGLKPHNNDKAIHYTGSIWYTHAVYSLVCCVDGPQSCRVLIKLACVSLFPGCIQLHIPFWYRNYSKIIKA